VRVNEIMDAERPKRRRKPEGTFEIRSHGAIVEIAQTEMTLSGIKLEEENAIVTWVTIDDRPVILDKHEFELLRILISHPEQIVAMEIIIEETSIEGWRALREIAISLRRKLGDGYAIEARDGGYTLSA